MDEWKLDVIHPVYKKGDRLDCANFRAMTVLIVACKILSQIFFCRLSPVATDFDIWGTIFIRSLQFLGFVDDIDIIGRTTVAVCEAYTRLKREAERIGLRINATKTKYLLAGVSVRDKARLGSRVSVDGAFSAIRTSLTQFMCGFCF